jgi:hypothetical protein
MNRSRALYALAAAFSLLPLAVPAQTVVVRVRGPAATPVFGALAHLVDASGSIVKNALTDERGRALFIGMPAATYRVRVEMIGMSTGESDLFEVAEGMSVPQDITLESSAIQLEGIEVALDGGRCTLHPEEEGLAIAAVWDEARKALSAAAFTDELGAYRYETMVYNRQLDTMYTILSEEETRREGYMHTPFDSRPAEDLMSNGFVQADGRDQVYYAPNASVLLSDAFLDSHCFRLAREDGASEGMIGLSFEPTGDDKSVVDIAGTMWIDKETAELRWLDFNYEYLDRAISSRDAGGRVDFRRMPSGSWIVPEWWIRMPVLARGTDFQGNPRRFVNGFHVTGGRVLEAREAGGRSLGLGVQTGGVEGLVVDSIGVARRGVRVGVVGSNQEVFTNAEGRYSITGLNPGRYQVRFVDPALELYGFRPDPVPRDVIRGEVSTLDQHMPSVGDVLFDACRGQSRPENSAVLLGRVRDALGRPVPGANVRVLWTDFHLRTVNRLVLFGGDSSGFETTSDAEGFYMFCQVPTDVSLEVQGLLGEVRSEVYPLRVGLDLRAHLLAIEIR